MRKRDELTDPKSCMSRAGDDEWTFVLLGRDAAAPLAVRFWITERVRLGKNQYGDPQIAEALAWAQAVEAEQAAAREEAPAQAKIMKAPRRVPPMTQPEPDRPTLFRLGDFTLHGGGRSRWKIDCDALTGADWEALAYMVAERVGAFGEAHGVPRGGLPLADALRPYARPHSPYVLVVDDVLTTGGSMELARTRLAGRHGRSNVLGAVVFARGPCPPWVVPLFRMTEGSLP